MFPHAFFPFGPGRSSLKSGFRLFRSFCFCNPMDRCHMFERIKIKHSSKKKESEKNTERKVLPSPSLIQMSYSFRDLTNTRGSYEKNNKNKTQTIIYHDSNLVKKPCDMKLFDMLQYCF